MGNLQHQWQRAVAPRVVAKKYCMKKVSVLFLFQCLVMLTQGQELFTSPKSSTTTRWISPENPTGEKGAAGKANQGGKRQRFSHGQGRRTIGHDGREGFWHHPPHVAERYHPQKRGAKKNGKD